ncbi:TPA: hypothetical protein UME25_000581 [Stenotrophomonas maltophilia]|uniref:hypothetical protein n=1 Tax=Stenotrophomonas sp. Sm6012 TaxID=3002745 RepID=UPI001311021D|nr:hypothetical protein [Stenotrophomonas sp. Sm6012]MDQ7280816.1 hypothetical protein [Stenotrophomonas sp. Sm6012]HEL3178493.1 hypothetical protein [Stenotrophomonas maltophilia]
MLKGFKPLTAAALCLLGLSAFAQNAAAAQWVDSGRTAYLKYSFFGSFAEHTCNAGAAPIQGYPGGCANDAPSGWTANYTASSGLANEQVNACGHNPFQLGSACYGLAYAINGQVYAGGLPAACNVGARAVVTSARMETVEIQYEELDVDFIESAQEYICQ